YPNGPAVEMEEGRELSSLYPVRGDFYIPDDNKYLVTSDTLLNQEDDDHWKGATYVSMHGYGWNLCFAKVASSTKGSMTLTDTDSGWFDPAKKNTEDWGYLSGHRNCMDIPGEWIMEENVLSIIPPKGETAESLSVEVKKRQIAVDLSYRKHVRLEGISTFGGGIRMAESEMCMLDGLDAKYIGHFTYAKDTRGGYIDDKSEAAKLAADGAIVRGEIGIYVTGKDNYVINSTVDHSPAASIVLAGLYAYVENNTFSNSGYMGTYVSGVMIAAEPSKAIRLPRGGHAIYNNEIYNAGRGLHNMQHEGMSGDWGTGWVQSYIPHEMAYNDFHDGILFSLDTGLTYEYEIVARTHRKDARIHHNYVYKTSPGTNLTSAGIYHDTATVGFRTYDNIVFMTQPGTDYTIYHITQSAYANQAAVYTYRNMELKQEPVIGGPEKLTTEQFNYGQPFFAGTLDKAAGFTRNLNGESAEADIVSVADAAISEGAERLENGRVVLDAAGEYVEFKNVNLTDEGRNVVDLYYLRDSFKGKTSVEVGVGDSVETATFTFVNLNSMTPERDTLSKDKCQISLATGVKNVYIRMPKNAAITIDAISLRKNERVNAGHDGALVWAGTFDRVAKAGSTPPSAKGNSENPTVNNTWGTCEIVYEDVRVAEDAQYFYINASSGSGYAGQKVIVRYYIDGAPTEPVFAETVTPDTGWKRGADEYFKLPDDMPRGTMDITVRFEGQGSCDFRYFGFAAEMPEV
ncbi:MAG: carbohydrate-binding protein, partial [Clostridia bacterium]|nr:carbohydrate-binding protein [Clostridia bacterium]